MAEQKKIDYADVAAKATDAIVSLNLFWQECEKNGIKFDVLSHQFLLNAGMLLEEIRDEVPYI